MYNQENKENLNNHEDKISKKLDEAFHKESNSVTGFFIKHFRFTYLIVLTILVLGTFSFFVLPREAEPEVRVPFGIVSTVYPGSNPSDVEELITRKIEDEVKNLDNLEKITSRSGQGVSVVQVEFDANADMEKSINDLKDAVDKAKNKLPKDAENPYVSEANFNDFALVTYSLVGDFGINELKEYADILKDDLEAIKGVSRVDVIGGLEREFQVVVDQARLSNYNISLSQIAGALSSTNINLPAGNIEVDDFNYNIKVAGKFKTLEDLNNVVVTTYENSPVLLSDIALIEDTFEEQKSISRIGFLNEKAKTTVSLQVYKRTGGNIIKIVDSSKKEVEKFKKRNDIPEELEIVKTDDNSQYIKEDLTTLGMSGGQTFILIALILLLVLSLSGAIITAISVPLAFLMTFIYLYTQGITLNSMVLFSLVLSLGLMVDNSIVIIEGINEYITKYNKSVYEAAVLSVWNFKWPIIAGTLTTVSAFVPMLFVSGIMGEYMSVLPKTISVTLLSSLFVAIVVIPTLATRFIKIKENGHKNGRTARRHVFVSRQVSKLHKKYSNFLERALVSKSKRWIVVLTFWCLFLLVILLPISGIMKVEMFSSIDFDRVPVNIELPNSSSLDKTNEITSQVEEIVAELPELDNYVSKLGVGSSDKANVTITLVDKSDRDRKSYEIANDLRAKFKEINGAEVTIEEIKAGPPSGSPIEVRIFGDDLDRMGVLASEIKNYFKTVDGVKNVDDSVEEATGEFAFEIDRAKANYYGLSVSQIASTLRNAVFGTTATKVNVAGEDIEVIVKYDKDLFTTPESLNDILIFNSRGESISLGDLTKINLEPSLLNIRRQDGEKIIRVTADKNKGADLRKIIAGFEDKKQEFNIPEGVKIVVGGETEDITKSFQEIFLLMFVAVILIFGILVLQFNSFKQPFIVIFALPLAMVGVIPGLMLVGESFSFMVFIGIVALAGIVVNDAIVLIDGINKNIKDGIEFDKAIIEGGVSRMQPIILTSITTVFGVFPLVYSNEMWKGLSLTIIFGLTFSTILTLIVMPLMYAGMCKDKKKIEE